MYFSKQSGCSSAPTFFARIYIGGDLAFIKQVCRAFCGEKGLCVTVDPTTFIYTGGEETGAVVGLINYPRFPATNKVITDLACELADILMTECHQKSCTIMTPSDTVFLQKDVKEKNDIPQPSPYPTYISGELLVNRVDPDVWYIVRSDDGGDKVHLWRERGGEECWVLKQYLRKPSRKEMVQRIKSSS